MRFDLVDLALFHHVIETGSITAGAARANMSLASASGRIRGMEELLGTALLHRGRRGVCPTEAGWVVADHARMILRQVDCMRGDLADHAKGLRCQIRMFVNTVAASEFLPDPMAIFLRENPLVDLDVSALPSARTVAAVAAGDADLGIIADHVPTADLALHPFRRDRLVAVFPPDHPLMRTEKVALRDLLDERFVALPPGSALQRLLDDHATTLGRRLQVRVRCSDFSSICRMVSHRVGIAIIPEMAAARQPQELVRTIPLSDAWAVRTLLICMHADRPVSPRVRSLLDHLGRGAPISVKMDGSA